jgi:starch synthase (maltosyl-transferring)
MTCPSYNRSVTWCVADRTRIFLVPTDHRLDVAHSCPFDATLAGGQRVDDKAKSARMGELHMASFGAPHKSGDTELVLKTQQGDLVSGRVRFLSVPPELFSPYSKQGLVLLSNGRGGMARMYADLGRIQSKYDCVLGASLHPNFPVDRHVFVKRIRAWLKVEEAVLAQLGKDSLVVDTFEAGPPACWRFAFHLPDGQPVFLELVADMLDQLNTTVLRFSRPTGVPDAGPDPFAQPAVRLTVRVDIEDRNFHLETKCNGGAEYHFSSNSRELSDRVGFVFAPARDRQLRVVADTGLYHHQGEWCWNIPHPIEQSRGQEGSGDAYSPGWFDLPLPPGGNASLVFTAETSEPPVGAAFIGAREAANEAALMRASQRTDDEFGRQLVLAIQHFVVRRNEGKTVIAGYPWFLDWGRDSLISARGLLAAGMIDEVKELLILFGRYEDRGTLPNCIHGCDVSNRETSDAPLWYGVACEEVAGLEGENFYDAIVDQRGRTIGQVLYEIGLNYVRGTPSGVHMDNRSGLIWSPPHFTWMDTNFPAGTPREGYPIEIQVLWIRLLRQLGRLGVKVETEPWAELAERAQRSLTEFYWLEQRHEGISYLADSLTGPYCCPAADARPDDALRSNFLFAVSMDLLDGEPARRCVDAALKYLVVPGALRSLAPLPVKNPLEIRNLHGTLLNDPSHPYWPYYEGDEDTRRKPAYHNGTAWTWTFPSFCEALAKAWNFEAFATEAAKAYLGSMGRLLAENCVGQLPEILDGDYPHWQRGCDAQAWSATEALRVWKLLNSQHLTLQSRHLPVRPST